MSDIYYQDIRFKINRVIVALINLTIADIKTIVNGRFDEDVETAIKTEIDGLIEVYKTKDYRKAFNKLSYPYLLEYYGKICQLAEALNLPILGRSELPESEIIRCNLNNLWERRHAAIAFSNSEKIKIVIATSYDEKYTITFKNPDPLLSITDDEIAKIDAAFGQFSMTVGVANVAASKAGKIQEFTKALGRFSAGVTGVAIVVDFIQWRNNPNLDTTSDLIISGIGFVGVPGAAISIGLTLAKQGGKAVAPIIGQAIQDLEIGYTNLISQALYGFDVRK